LGGGRLGFVRLLGLEAGWRAGRGVEEGGMMDGEDGRWERKGDGKGRETGAKEEQKRRGLEEKRRGTIVVPMKYDSPITKPSSQAL